MEDSIIVILGSSRTSQPSDGLPRRRKHQEPKVDKRGRRRVIEFYPMNIIQLFSVPIDQIKEIRTGRNCESLRNREISSTYNEERIFSILYGASYDSLDLIAHSPEEANIWVTGLNALIGVSQCKSSDMTSQVSLTLIYNNITERSPFSTLHLGV